MTIQQLVNLINKNTQVTSIETKEFGTIIRANGLKILDDVRYQALKNGHNTPISCHREDGSCEAFMIVWNK